MNGIDMKYHIGNTNKTWITAKNIYSLNDITVLVDKYICHLNHQYLDQAWKTIYHYMAIDKVR